MHTTLKIFKMELAQKLLPLLMKPTGPIYLVVFVRDDLRHGELWVSFGESMVLGLVAGVHSLTFLAN